MRRALANIKCSTHVYTHEEPDAKMRPTELTLREKFIPFCEVIGGLRRTCRSRFLFRLLFEVSRVTPRLSSSGRFLIEE
ncbi:hypothetical protein RRG08_066292 [Elysia crispata]|uniref:Uncharacterized protein n=1 Tax=Elysia crispata TaxID=231223 RepID=A0AAE1ANX1_9GAST|nr:hypothetical protein RRG08_066292 [Elysia crispata]